MTGSAQHQVSTPALVLVGLVVALLGAWLTVWLAWPVLTKGWLP